MKKLISLHYPKIKSLYTRYERWLMPTTLACGFLLDYFTFTNIKFSITFTILLLYWAVAGATIFFVHAYDAQKIPQKYRYVRLFAPLLLQFLFGNLFSASLVFYWFSGVFSISWPIIAIVILLMVSNDVFRHYFDKPVVQLAVYFFVTLSISSLVLPFLFTSLSPWFFIIAGMASALIFFVFLYCLGKVQPMIQSQRRPVFAVTGAILLLMNLLYFTNIIPPIPLALREAGLYHSVTKINGSYLVKAEKDPFFKTLFFGQTLHLTTSESMYAYTAVFAPTDLKTTIVHHWQHYDENKKKWVSVAELPFDIVGGLRTGYKGYSWISKLDSGRWRVYVENSRGQVLGRIKFNVARVEAPAALQEIIR